MRRLSDFVDAIPIKIVSGVFGGCTQSWVVQAQHPYHLSSFKSFNYLVCGAGQELRWNLPDRLSELFSALRNNFPPALIRSNLPAKIKEIRERLDNIFTHLLVIKWSNETMLGS